MYWMNKFCPGVKNTSGASRLTYFFFFSSRRRHTRCSRDWSSDVCSSDLYVAESRLARGKFQLASQDREDAHDGLQDRGLAGTVGAQHADKTAARDLKIDPFQDRSAVVAQARPVETNENAVAHGRLSPIASSI